jgi:hypothetical protein
MIAERFGPDALLRLYRATNMYWFNEALGHVLGLTFAQLNQMFHDYLNALTNAPTGGR